MDFSKDFYSSLAPALSLNQGRSSPSVIRAALELATFLNTDLFLLTPAHVSMGASLAGSFL